MNDDRRPRVFVVGSLNADHRVHVARLPAPGETVLASDTAVTAGGKGANQAVAAARAGAPTTIVGAIGDDPDGRLLARALAEQDIDARHVRVIPDSETGRALITVDRRGENTIIVAAGTNEMLTAADIDEGLRDITAGDLLLLQLETPEPLVRHAARVASGAGATVVLNPTPVPDSVRDLFDDVDLLVVNEHELAHLADDIASLARKADATVICTLGADGVDVTHRGERRAHRRVCGGRGRHHRSRRHLHRLLRGTSCRRTRRHPRGDQGCGAGRWRHRDPTGCHRIDPL